MNNNIIERLVRLLLSLSNEKTLFLEKKLLLNSSYTSTAGIIELANRSKKFDFLHNEPDLYKLDDGKLI